MDSFDQNSQDVGLSLDLIADEIEAGLPLHADRLVAAYDAEEYYAGRSAAYIPRRESEEWRDYVKRPKRTSKLTFKVIQTLAKGLYDPGPTRRLKDTAADAFLQDVYEKNHVNAIMKEADRKATLHGLCAIQAHATGRPEKPVQLYLWGAHELVVWTWPDDPTEAWATCTIAKERRFENRGLEERLRYDVWSRDEHRVYRSRWQAAPSVTAQGYAQTCYRYLFGQPMTLVQALSGEPAGSGVNPYGVLPFSFAHNEPVVSDFYAGGLGNSLVECNAEVDRELSDLADHAREFMSPDRFLTGVSAAFRREKSIGRWQLLPPGKDSEGEAATPKAELVQAKLAISEVWENIQTYANNTIEELDVPLVAVRTHVSSNLSGIAIVAQHVPLLERIKERQPLYGVAETELAAMVLLVAGNAYGQDVLRSAAVAPDLELVWPAPRFPLPTPERDLEDAWELDQGVKSLVDIVAERQGITHEAARDVIERVAEDNAWLATVLQPTASQQATADQQATDLSLQQESGAGTKKAAGNAGTPTDPEESS